MNSIVEQHSAIHFNDEGYDALNALLSRADFSKIVILVDENTHDHCLNDFLQMVDFTDPPDVIEIEPGEEHKNVDTCSGAWEALSELECDRNSLLINLGGGVVTDLGGFVASTFKRGIAYINVPTSLLAMVDASVGGKTGVDLGVLKNQVGMINFGEMVLIDTSFLISLPANHMRSGMAEMYKHGLISDTNYWKKMAELNDNSTNDLDALIYESVLIKHKIVSEDPNENGMRKSLNFGHTLGHAIESYFLAHPEKEILLHGEAIAVGMILETFISNKLLGFPTDKMEQVKDVIIGNFGKIDIEASDLQPIINLMKFDKKNSHGKINFVLLEDIGSVKTDCEVENSILLEAFDYYKS